MELIPSHLRMPFWSLFYFMPLFRHLDILLVLFPLNFVLDISHVGLFYFDRYDKTSAVYLYML